MKLKPPSGVVACVVDYGYFPSLAATLSKSYSRVYYYTPFESEYGNINRYIIGEGIPGVERLNDLFDPKTFASIDLFVFPDIGYVALQRFLESQGKAVWGSREATNLELYRSLFLEALDEMGLPVPKSKVVKGVAALESLLKKERDKWVKIDLYRENMETWHHLDYEHSLPMLRYLAATFGGVSETITFVVQDPIPDAQENGYDGYSVDGQFPSRSFQGYEKKNELYLGAWLPAKEMPENVLRVNEAIAPKLKSINYRNFFATELRDEFFIDPTPRMAGQSQEHLLENCTNLADIIWAGANGTLLEPEFKHKFGASATLHYEDIPGEGWRSVRIPSKAQRWFKMGNYCQDGEIYNFPPCHSDEIGVVIGMGDTIEATIADLKTHLKAIEDEPVCAEVEGFADILRDAAKAQEAGEGFTKAPIPPPEVAIA
jgi:hypothetical protein